MRLDRSILSLVRRGAVVGLVAVSSGCPDATPPAPPPVTVLPVVAPVGSSTEPVKKAAPQCGGEHADGVAYCPHCDYCPGCGGG